MIDFVTLAFNNNIEIELLKLQAKSFLYVEPEFIGKIFIFYNDNGNDKLEFIKEYYPKKFIGKVNIIYKDSIFGKNINSDWRNQQYYKLFISNFIVSKYYVVLDAKNHFIRQINLNDFIKNNKPKIFVSTPGNMLKYYKNCLAYFKINDPFNCTFNDCEQISNRKSTFLTTTPFIFIKEEVLNLIKYIETKEKMTFYDFFMQNKSITEFYLYSTYLLFSNNINKHEIVERDNFVVTIFRNPNINWNKYESKKKAIKNNKVKVFGLHRKAVEKMDDNYKRNLMTLYSNFYDKEICTMIRSILYP